MQILGLEQMSEEEKLEILVSSKVPEELIGWLETELPKPVMSRLQSYIETAKKNPISLNDDLAGNISKSLTLKDKDDWFFKTILLVLINKFMQTFPSYRRQVHTFTEGVPFCLDPFWVNFQKENEFNPLHDHSGVFSFVIWIKIPTDWREQHKIPFVAQSVSPCASDFEFHYTTMLGTIGTHTYCLDKKSEGFMLFFPASLQHIVYPFYNCDKERISISGNIRFDISENSMKQYRMEKNG